MTDPQYVNASDLEVFVHHPPTEWTDADSGLHPTRPEGPPPPIPSTPEAEKEPQAQRRLLGLPRTTFYLLLTLIALIVALAVTGGVTGPSSASANAARTSSTSSAAATRSTGSSGADPASFIPFSGCPEVNGTMYEAQLGRLFQKVCDRDWHPVPAEDLLNIMVQTWDLCIEACASYTRQGGTRCQAATFVPQWSTRKASDGDKPSNCILKSRADGPGLDKQKYVVHTARLIS
ncbi:MAG: hypothetical protein M1823_000221 [Watsoniomyces obsoletus]|nr:MAG: hypothetical protein M1823_000221 [Watsoniomyces obsoletus]